ncbi:MAG TPA: PAS domain-containing protein [Methylocella sp.]|nr:PAS domain-containing protein [Methylocella sp.]
MYEPRPSSDLLLTSARSRQILQSIPTVIYELAVTEKGFSPQWVSDSVKIILGYEAEEALAPDWWISHLHPDDMKAAAGKTQVLMTQDRLVQEYRFQAKDGDYLWIRDEASLLHEADGRPKEIVGFWTNITEHKQAQEHEAQAREQETEIGEFNQSTNRIALRLVIMALIVGSGFVLLAGEGSLSRGMTLLGLSTFAIGSSLALTLAWLRLKLDKRSSHILNSIPTVIYELGVTPKGFPTQWVSDSVKRILGYEVEEALAPDWWIRHLHPDDKKAAVEKTPILMREGRLVQEYRFEARDGRYLWIRDEASLLRRSDGRPKEIVGFWTDITERKLSEARAAKAREEEAQRGELSRSSDRNIVLAAVIGVLIVGSGFLLFNHGARVWETAVMGLGVFAASYGLGLILVWRVVKSGTY